jgi:hypothetical protein
MDSEKEEQEVTYQAAPFGFPFQGGWLSPSSLIRSSCGRTKLAFKVPSSGAVQ